MLKHRLYWIFLFQFHLWSSNKQSLLGWNLVSALHDWKLLKNPFSYGFMSLSSWPSMDLDKASDGLLLSKILSAKIRFRLLKGTTWAVALTPWLGDLSDAFSCTCLLCSKAQCVSLHFYSHLKEALDGEEVMAERIFLGVQRLVKTFSFTNATYGAWISRIKATFFSSSEFFIEEVFIETLQKTLLKHNCF